jgi:hypothetical protein
LLVGLEKAAALARAAGVGAGIALSLFRTPPAGAATADLILSLRSLHVDRGASTRLANARLLADGTLRRPVRFHLDLNRDEPESVELYEAYLEWGAGTTRARWGRFQVPFGIHNRSELYYVGLMHDPLIKDYPLHGPHLIDSASGAEYLRAVGPWQVEGALFSHRGVGGILPSGDEGALRVQWFGGPLILGASAVRERGSPTAPGQREAVRFLGLDWRLSRPHWIVRGEWVTGRVAGASPGGFYVDLLYHPTALPRITFVGRIEAVDGESATGSQRRQTVGFKWELPGGTALALNQVFGTARSSPELRGTALFLWHTQRF